MGLRPKDMLRVGELFLNRGRVGDKQVVPESWIDRMWEVYTISPWNGHRHGYFWWSRRFGGEQTHFAWGYGGQYIFIVPRLELVVVMTSSLINRPRGGDHNRIVQRSWQMKSSLPFDVLNKIQMMPRHLGRVDI